MEEENNTEEQIVEDLAQKAVDDAKKGTKKVVKIAAKNVIAALAHAIFSFVATFLPYIAIVVTIIVIISGLSHILELSTGEDTTKAVYSALGIEKKSDNSINIDGDIASIIEIKPDSQGYHLEFNVDLDTKLEDVIQQLNKQNTSIKINNKDLLKKFIIAEAVTKYPNLGGENDGNTKLQGIINFKRITPNKQIGETTQVGYREVNLKYIDKKIFDGYIQNNDSTALDYFSFDENKNVIIASWSLIDGALSLKYSSPINYRDAISMYTMPFEYPLFFLIDGGSESFCNDLADLAINNSSMEIAIIDNVINTTQITKTIENVTEKKEVYLIKENGVEERIQDAYIPDVELSPVVTQEVQKKSEEVSQTIEISEIDSWAFKKNKTNIQDSSTYTPFNEVSRTTSPSTIKDTNVEVNGNTKNVTTQSVIITTVEEEESSTNSYSFGDTEVEENYEEFVSIYEKYKRTLNNNLLPDWLFELMENNGKTSNLIQTTKFLLYKATNVNYGVTSLDDINFSFSDIMSDAKLSQDGNIQLIHDYISQWENLWMYKYIYTDEVNDQYETNQFIKDYVTKDKHYFKCGTDINSNNGTRNFGFGVMHYQNGSYNNVDYYKKENINIKDPKYLELGSTIPVDVVERISIEIIKFNRNKILEHARNVGVDLNDNQINALTYAAHKYGPFDTNGRYKDIPTALRLYKQYGDTEEFRRNCFIFSDNRSNWSNALWNVFHNGVYKNDLGETIVTNNYYVAGSLSAANGDEYGYDNVYTSSSGNVYKLFIQNRYEHVYYWGNNVRKSGCGPSSAAIILSGFGTNDTPETVAKYPANGSPVKECNFFTNRGFKASCESANWDKAIQHLKSGNPLVANISGKIQLNEATYTGHYITFLDIDEAGEKIFIGDPGWGGAGSGWFKISYLQKSNAFVNFIYVSK